MCEDRGAFLCHRNFRQTHIQEHRHVATVRLTALLVTTLVFAELACALTIDSVPIGNPGNPPDTRYDATGVGSVPYAFRMARTELTNAQYVEFLNAVATSDPYGLFDPPSTIASWVGIAREGSPGNYSYSVKVPASGQGPGGTDYTYETKPVVGVSWFDGLRFANWLHNGQGGGDTETGAYTLLGGTPIPSNWQSITRNPGAKWWLPNDNEWYKAAYYDSVTRAFYDFPTGTDTPPTRNLPSADTGNSANFLLGATGKEFFPFTDVGAYMLSGSPFGTFDQGGNVKEWTETTFNVLGNRLVRGGSWRVVVNYLSASQLDSHYPTDEYHWLGFRVATVIPEPSTLVLLGLGVLLFARRMRR